MLAIETGLDEVGSASCCGERPKISVKLEVVMEGGPGIFYRTVAVPVEGLGAAASVRLPTAPGDQVYYNFLADPQLFSASVRFKAQPAPIGPRQRVRERSLVEGLP